MTTGPAAPAPDCPFCPRLAAFRASNATTYPGYYNSPVPSFGALDARLLIIGLAPGLHGANRTGRPFTGDYAGDLLYPTLTRHGFAKGDYGRELDDGLGLIDCRITNAVRCVPPKNKPTGTETRTCLTFLRAEIEAMADLRALLALGRVAHEAVLAGVGERRAARPFGHGARHPLAGGLTLYDSYHCSRYNVNTGRLSPAMFNDLVARIADELKVVA